MRIRKRQVPLPLSSLSPVPLSSLSLSSDPHTYSRPGRSPLPPVQLLLRPAADVDTVSKLSDQAPNRAPDAADPPELVINGEEKLIISSSNDSSSVPAPAKTGGSTQVVSQSGTSHRGGRWYEAANSASPQKRRRNRDDDDEELEEDGEGMNNADGAVENKLKNNRSASSNVRKRGRGGGGGSVLEGSRCSRVNGRGWRCCQPTLVGYSLCEHHLGKGRLRSMMNVRSHRLSKPPTAPVLLGSSRAVLMKEPKDEDDQDGDDVDEKKTKKLGAVKARSMSSLLGQAGSNIRNASSISASATPMTNITTEAVASNSNVRESSHEA